MNKLLDNIQNWTQNGPQGNDKQYLPLIGAGISGILGIMAANKGADSFEGLDIEALKEQLKPSLGLIGNMGERADELWGRAKELWDPKSAINQADRSYLKNQSHDVMANAFRNIGRTNNSSGGGINLSQILANKNDMGRNLQTTLGNQFTNSMKTNRSMGNSLFGMGGSMYGNQLSAQQGYDSTLANAHIQKSAQANTFNAALYGGASQGLLSGMTGFGNMDWDYSNGWKG
tara:strand:- start:1197 stop:1889 length:693 start_codon:yes stop_codon:yes gene_type:complete